MNNAPVGTVRFRFRTTTEPSKDSDGHTRVDCLCDPHHGGCGKSKRVRVDYLLAGKSKSCGCLTAEINRSVSTTHGATVGGRTSEYGIWKTMKARCKYSSQDSFKDYGGRGIYVCSRWSGSFAEFLADMGPKPTPKHSIDRLNSNGSYTCGKCDDCIARGAIANCRWATLIEQGSNKSSNRLITHDGLTLTASEWERRIGAPTATVLGRLHRGWSPEEAIQFARPPSLRLNLATALTSD
jgi:hypothetical protein